MVYTLIFTLLFATLVGVVWYRYALKKRNEKEIKEKVAEQRKLKERISREQMLFEEKEKYRILTKPEKEEYTPIQEVPIKLSTNLPKDKRNIYFIGINGDLTDKLRGILIARFKDLGLYFIDMEIMKTITEEVVNFWFPANVITEEQPNILYESLKEELDDSKTHFYVIRYDFTKGFVYYDLYNPNIIVFTKNASSYILYSACGYTHPKDDFYTSKTPFITKPAPISLPNIKEATEEDSGSGTTLFRKSFDATSPSYEFSPKTQKILSQVSLNDEEKDTLAEILEKVKRLQLNGTSLTLIQALIGKTTRLSELRITKHYKIFLTDFNNLEIKLNPLQTTVYILFLNHPEGISFYNLPDYKDEIRDIYGKITGRDDLIAIENTVEALIDRFGNTMNENISRIRRAFCVLPEDIAKNYYISGSRGEDKRISLSRAYVRREDNNTEAVNFDSPIAQKGREYQYLISASNFDSFTDLSFLLRPLSHIQFKIGYVPDAFWCGTKDNRYLKLYACKDGSTTKFVENSNTPYEDSMFLEGIYSVEQSSKIPPITNYITASCLISVWEAYLLATTETLIPHLESSTAERRRYIMSHRDLVETVGESVAQDLRMNINIVPKVTIKRNEATISCCYASSKYNGLCREIINAEIHSSYIKFKPDSITVIHDFNQQF